MGETTSSLTTRRKRWLLGTDERFLVLALSRADVVWANKEYVSSLSSADMRAIAEYVSSAIVATVDYWDLVEEATTAVVGR